MGRSPSPAAPVRVRPSSSACRPPVGADPLDFGEVGTVGADAAPRRIFPRFAKQREAGFHGPVRSRLSSSPSQTQPH